MAMLPRQREAMVWGACLVLASVVFLAWPGLDLNTSMAYYSADSGFSARQWPWVDWVYHGAPRLGQALSPWLFGLLLAELGAAALWCSAGLALSALAALLLIRHHPPENPHR